MAEQQQQQQPSPSPSPSSPNAAVSPILRSSKSPGTPLNPDEATKMLNEEHITRLTEDAVRKLTLYTRNELQATTEDCQLLETMNKTTKEKYADMSQMGQRLMKEMSRLQNTYADFSTFMAQVDDIDQQTIEIEKVARALDDYSRYLEDKLMKANPSSSGPT
ncbi:biogenesis of lysosome-related organelles complex-1 subunit 2-domain-containing protein [Zychaea mexicana]|uniref:biogenesis of lysosome-related organelles complex-1 subunit 2-domain-containing protein n=1 Tax=Zychaea mexicana TaxID=64656 RepID=UPI0022FF0137|nr:biogenesis of lysosome-related organelles complex-1 subunit 2-domain-containing protein [Zychaea mexicana]KAI9498581.1 biogenesis of lysosome-related organelles complex-1 subunit 2-domain-containing protein [Zychaea mexicana]